jgi:hypothetical protein
MSKISPFTEQTIRTTEICNQRETDSFLVREGHFLQDFSSNTHDVILS